MYHSRIVQFRPKVAARVPLLPCSSGNASPHVPRGKDHGKVGQPVVQRGKLSTGRPGRVWPRDRGVAESSVSMSSRATSWAAAGFRRHLPFATCFSSWFSGTSRPSSEPAYAGLLERRIHPCHGNAAPLAGEASSPHPSRFRNAMPRSTKRRTGRRR
jgi:hypothetical protein